MDCDLYILLTIDSPLIKTTRFFNSPNWKAQFNSWNWNIKSYVTEPIEGVFKLIIYTITSKPIVLCILRWGLSTLKTSGHNYRGEVRCGTNDNANTWGVQNAKSRKAGGFIAGLDK